MSCHDVTPSNCLEPRGQRYIVPFLKHQIIRSITPSLLPNWYVSHSLQFPWKQILKHAHVNLDANTCTHCLISILCSFAEWKHHLSQWLQILFHIGSRNQQDSYVQTPSYKTTCHRRNYKDCLVTFMESAKQFPSTSSWRQVLLWHINMGVPQNGCFTQEESHTK